MLQLQFQIVTNFKVICIW